MQCAIEAGWGIDAGGRIGIEQLPGGRVQKDGRARFDFGMRVASVTRLIILPK
jgi:hypothetical protein